MKSAIYTALFAVVVLFFAANLLNSVTVAEDTKSMEIEGSGTCYRIAGEHAQVAAIRAMARDRFFSKAECRQIYSIVDAEDKASGRFIAQKIEALRQFNY